MDDLVKKLVDELGLEDAVAQQAIQIVMGFMKDKLPGGLGGQVEGILNGGDPAELLNQLGGDKAAGGVMGMLGGLLGKK